MLYASDLHAPVSFPKQDTTLVWSVISYVYCSSFRYLGIAYIDTVQFAWEIFRKFTANSCFRQINASQISPVITPLVRFTPSNDVLTNFRASIWHRVDCSQPVKRLIVLSSSHLSQGNTIHVGGHLKFVQFY